MNDEFRLDPFKMQVDLYTLLSDVKRLTDKIADLEYRLQELENKQYVQK
jgi:hypothetical protein